VIGGAVPYAAGLRDALALIKCLDCGSPLELQGSDGAGGAGLTCTRCAREYPIVRGTPVLLRQEASGSWLGRDAELRRRTAESFAYEWEHFGELRPEWELNFREYMRPHEPEWFRDRVVLDVGAGSGRHSYEAHRLGARVIAVDVGDAIHVARRNLPSEVITVQADAEELPFGDETFDLVMAIGVLHHLPDPRRPLRSLARLVRPNGYVHIYVYWVPPRPWHRSLLRLVTATRRMTIRMPRPMLRALSYPIAATLFGLFVLPYRHSRHIGRLKGFAEGLPLKAYADYPFGVCVNDQFDRFSAPLEWRFSAEEVRAMLEEAGFVDVTVLENNGWVGSGRRPPV
jgi:ubiquinone/menaquinone biosynthesis C-methylase UbiE/uncharacterized protein YbaR (Trm112 family)